jgi:hypothetical protein
MVIIHLPPSFSIFGLFLYSIQALPLLATKLLWRFHAQLLEQLPWQHLLRQRK